MTGEVKYEGEGFEYVGSVFKSDNGEFVFRQLEEFWADGLPKVSVTGVCGVELGPRAAV